MEINVEIIESEKGFGQKVDEVKPFPNREEAEAFCSEYNTRYNPPKDQTPDWYMYARIQGDRTFGMIR